MLRVDTAKWEQSAEDLRRAGFEEGHSRTRERFAALYEMSRGVCPTHLAEPIGRPAQTLMSWVKRYNAEGPQGLHDRPSGGRPPFVKGSRRNSTD